MRPGSRARVAAAIAERGRATATKIAGCRSRGIAAREAWTMAGRDGRAGADRRVPRRRVRARPLRDGARARRARRASATARSITRKFGREARAFAERIDASVISPSAVASALAGELRRGRPGRDGLARVRVGERGDRRGGARDPARPDRRRAVRRRRRRRRSADARGLRPARRS